MRLFRVAWGIALAVPGVLTFAQPASASVSATPTATAQTETRTLTRDKQIPQVDGGGNPVLDGSGNPVVDNVNVDTRTVTVNVSKTQELMSRERVHVSWSGAHPTQGRAQNPFGGNGLFQEYPVAVMLCRGVDDPTAPVENQISPETCWTSTSAQRTAAVGGDGAYWRNDIYGSADQLVQNSGFTDIPADHRSECVTSASTSTHVTPFIAADKAVFSACNDATMPPEAAVDSVVPPNDMLGYTDPSGNGFVDFEVRTDITNTSLGCSRTVACSIVVVPIMGMSCTADASADCMTTGRQPVGQINDSGTNYAYAVSGYLWWAQSNWRSHFSFPLGFALPPDTCDLQDTRAPIGFYGSELLSQAALQWAPAYCLSADRFKFQDNIVPDKAGFDLMTQGQAPAAEVTSKHENTGSDPVAYAPTALTGFAISFVADYPNNAGEATTLNLTPRLVLKLLSQSYPGSAFGVQHPGLENNPWSINLDPDFRAVNAGFDSSIIFNTSAAALEALSVDSDAMTALTTWIAQDKEALAFLKGKPDPWGMVINSSYKKVQLPVATWPLLDTFVPTSNDRCWIANPPQYFSQLAAPVSSMRKIAESVLDGWPLASLKCVQAADGVSWSTGRIPQEGVGQRFVLGITTLGDAARYGLSTASLQTKKGVFVAPKEASILAAISHAKQTENHGAFELNAADLAKDATAYPGTMLVHTAARYSGLDKDTAVKVAQFINVSTTEGQRPGPGNGQLADGYVPLAKAKAIPFGSKKSVAGALVKAAAETAKVVKAQKGEPPPPATPAPATTTPTAAPQAPVAPAAPAVVATNTPAAPTEVAPAIKPVATKLVHSDVGGGLVPIAGFLGVLSFLVSMRLRFAGRRLP